MMLLLMMITMIIHLETVNIISLVILTMHQDYQRHPDANDDDQYDRQHRGRKVARAKD